MQTEERSTIQVDAAVCGTSSIASFSLPVSPVLSYPVCRLFPACDNYVPPPERMRPTVRNKPGGLVIRPQDPSHEDKEKER